VLELRDIEIFLTLAEELHFGRTAERLHLTPARVSQSIKAQERRIGGLLFERTSRTVRLTPLGKQLKDDLSDAHRQITEAVHNAARTASGLAGTLTLGSMGAQPWTITHVLDLFRSRLPDVNLHIREVQPTAPLDELRSGAVDVAHVWLPVDEPDLTVGPVVHTCDIVLAVSATHPYSSRDSVCWEDLADCVVVTGPAVPTSMEETFHPYFTPSGRPIPRGPVVNSWHEIMSTVAAGRAVAATASDVVRFYPWPNVVYVPIRDVPKCEWAFVWRSTNETPLIRALADIAADAGQA
jgi:DNA-binding transcriptional LysR family regulator